jgi:acyl-CoA dehydrogenase
VAALKKKVDKFVQEEVIPCEAEYASHMKDRHGADRWTMDAVPPCLSRLQKRAQELGIWNIFLPPRLIPHLPDPSLAPPLALTYREYGILCESLGRSIELAPQACNSSAPDTGNMEVLLEFGTQSQQRQYVSPSLWSVFLSSSMKEYQKSSSLLAFSQCI